MLDSVTLQLRTLRTVSAQVHVPVPITVLRRRVDASFDIAAPGMHHAIMELRMREGSSALATSSVAGRTQDLHGDGFSFTAVPMANRKSSSVSRWFTTVRPVLRGTALSEPVRPDSTVVRLRLSCRAATMAVIFSKGTLFLGLLLLLAGILSSTLLGGSLSVVIVGALLAMVGGGWLLLLSWVASESRLGLDILRMWFGETFAVEWPDQGS